MFYILRRRGLGLGSTKAIKELSQHDITIVRNDKLLIYSLYDTILRWGCTSPVTAPPNTVILNKNANISLVNNKQSFRFILKEQIPEIIPKTWFNYIDPEITYPCILRPSTHAQGKHLYYCENYIDLTNAVTKVNQ